jgi:dihydropteroate synthase
MERLYYRPIAMTDAASRPHGAYPLAGGWCWFDRVEVLRRGGPARIVPASEVPADALDRLIAPRGGLARLQFDRPRIMGILNVTPDSFSDGGLFDRPDAAITQAQRMVEAGADILDIGGESTRPGANAVPESHEIARTCPVIAALREAGATVPISIDTRKAGVAKAALRAGADMVNDVAALTYDPAMSGAVAAAAVPLCLMHAQGTPEVMQADPRYDNVLLDVYDFLQERVEAAVAAGIERARVVVDPGIGFGKTVQHNLMLLRGLSLFHGLGCPVLLGVSRKRFIGTIGGATEAQDRMPGSLAVTLAGVAQGVQIHRVHDVAEVAQGLRLWRAISEGYEQ